MKKINSLILIGLLLVIIESFLGFTFIFYGIMYKTVEKEHAETMLEFIRTNNPTYYEKLVDNKDSSYRREFYKHYTKRGNSLYKMGGALLIIIAINTAVILLYLFVNEKRAMMIPEQIEVPEEKTAEEEEKEPKSGENQPE